MHGAEFKAKVALEALRGVKTLNEIGQEYGVHPQLVSTWKLELQQQAKTLFDVKRGKKRVEEDASTERLYSEIGKLKMSLDWLQKKSGLIDTTQWYSSLQAGKIFFQMTKIER